MPSFLVHQKLHFVRGERVFLRLLRIKIILVSLFNFIFHFLVSNFDKFDCFLVRLVLEPKEIVPNPAVITRPAPVTATATRSSFAALNARSVGWQASPDLRPSNTTTPLLTEDDLNKDDEQVPHGSPVY